MIAFLGFVEAGLGFIVGCGLGLVVIAISVVILNVRDGRR